MDKEAAEALLAIAVSLDESIGKMYAEVRKFSDEEVRKQLDKAVGDLMGHIARDIIFPIVDRYPDLAPDF